jgi:transposase
MFYVGVDLGDKYSYLAILDREGELIEEARLPSTPGAFQRKFRHLDPSRVALEVGSHSRWSSQVIKELGHEVLVANARKLRAIYTNPRKNDRADAEILARLARVDPELLSPIRHRSAQAQADLAVIRARAVLVRSRTGLINHVRGSVKTAGVRLPSCTAANFVRRVADRVPEELGTTLQPILALIEQLSQQIRAYAAEIERLGREAYPESQPLQAVSGVGALTALTFVLTLEDPRRFAKSRQVGPALGLVPRRDQSGDHEPQLRITKSGDAYLRQLLVNCAHYILGPFGPECDLRSWGLKLAERGGKNAKKRAVIAVARKLAILLHHLWRSGETYDPCYQSGQSNE